LMISARAFLAKLFTFTPSRISILPHLLRVRDAAGTSLALLAQNPHEVDSGFESLVCQ
jgi:hypothetical protein